MTSKFEMIHYQLAKSNESDLVKNLKVSLNILFLKNSPTLQSKDIFLFTCY